MDQASLRRHVTELASAPRVPGTTEHVRAAAYIRQWFETYEYQLLPPSGRDNVIAEVGPAHAPLLVVGAHYDSVTTSPGADDNASGVAALLEIARAFAADRSVRHRVQFAAYDLEESGLLGSAEHCAALRREQAHVVGMMSLEMLGYTGENQTLLPGVVTKRTRGDFLAVVADEASTSLLDAFDDDPLIERLVIPSDAGYAAVVAGLSDHTSFREQGWPAVIVTDTSFLRNPHYHQRSDVPDSLDYAFLAASAEAALRALRRLAR